MKSRTRRFNQKCRTFNASRFRLCTGMRHSNGFPLKPCSLRGCICYKPVPYLPLSPADWLPQLFLPSNRPEPFLFLCVQLMLQPLPSFTELPLLSLKTLLFLNGCFLWLGLLKLLCLSLSTFHLPFFSSEPLPCLPACQANSFQSPLQLGDLNCFWEQGQ